MYRLEVRIGFIWRTKHKGIYTACEVASKPWKKRGHVTRIVPIGSPLKI